MMMNKTLFVLFAFGLTLAACSELKYQPYSPAYKSQDLMTSQDTYNSSFSNISITNGAGAPVMSSGVFVASYDVNDCSACFGGVMAGDNVSGAMIEPVSFSPGETIKIGQNYLYNLIYNGINVIRQNVGSSPCRLPGCSWNGDSSIAGWCLSLGLMSRQSPYTSSHYVNGARPPANVAPMGAASNSVPLDYKLGLINPATFGNGSACLGLVVCDDKTLTCKVNTPQNQKFEAY